MGEAFCLSPRCLNKKSYRSVAQLVEHRSPKPGAGGSSPSTPATIGNDYERGGLFRLSLFFRCPQIRKLLAVWYPNLRVFSIKGRKSDRLICA